MDDDRRRSGGSGGRGGVSHASRPYPGLRRAARGILAGLLLLLGARAGGADYATPLKPDGGWRTVTVAAPGQKVPYVFETVAGARYRVTAQPGTLARPVLEIGPGRDTVARVDAGASGLEASHEFYAERDGSLSLRVGGFSALTGTARIRLEAIDPEGKRTTPHRRILPVGSTLALVGELWLGESNRWDLLVVPGKAYEIRSTMGTAGRVILAVVLAGAPPGTPALATTEGATTPFPRLRFVAPGPSDDAERRPPRAVLEVRGVGGAGGTYGLYLQEVDRAEVGATEQAPGGRPGDGAPLPGPALLEGVPFGFRLRPGDVAMLYLPAAHPYDPHGLLVREQGNWTPVPADPLTPYGERASVRTPEGALAIAFRAHVAGEFRFPSAERAAGGRPPVLRVHDGAVAGGAPLLLGAPTDPMILGRARSQARVLGLGFCIPGFDYLFVAAGGGARDLGMRVRAMDGSVVAQRGGGAFAATEVAGVGPSLRFRVKEPLVVRLEVTGSAWRGYGLLRRASN